MNISAAIAWRLLISKKRHGAVATISTVSVCAMAIATAAIVCVLSVFNGFRSVIADRLDTLSPDIMVTPAKGKTMSDATELVSRIAKMQEVAVATPTLSDNALAIYNSQEIPVTIKGVVPAEYARVTHIREMIPKEFGSYSSLVRAADSKSTDSNTADSPVSAIIAVGVAARLRLYTEETMLIFAPRREGRVNLANPASSFFSDSVTIAGIYQTDQQKFDEDGVILPIETVRNLLQRDDDASAIEIALRPGTDQQAAVNKISRSLGTAYVVRDRLRQQEMNFRMVSIEKWISFLLLGFILIIAGFNIISSLSMMVIDKEKTLSTLSAIGLSRRRIGSIFAWESIYVALAGGLAGIVLGVILCLLQQKFGLIRIGGDPSASIIQAYPVELQPLDLLITLAPILAIGIATALITASFARSRIAINKNS